MQIVYDFGNGMRMVDLSKLVDPATETRRCKLNRFNTGGAIPDFHTNFDIMSHLGTTRSARITMTTTGRTSRPCR